MARPPRKPPARPTESLLHGAALTHLARYGATASGLLRVLDRRVARWAASEAGDVEGAAAARAAARRVVAKLAESGAVNDADYAEARSRSLRRAGKSGPRDRSAFVIQGRGPARCEQRCPNRKRAPNWARPRSTSGAGGWGRSGPRRNCPKPGGGNWHRWPGQAFRSRSRRQRCG